MAGNPQVCFDVAVSISLLLPLWRIMIYDKKNIILSG
jgi:hypothetical protein